MTIGFPPSTLMKKATVILCFNFLPPLVFSPYLVIPLLGIPLKKKPLSSIFQMFWQSYPVHSYLILFILDSTVVSDTPKDSPDICFFRMEWFNFHLSYQPSEALKLSNKGWFNDDFMFISSSSWGFAFFVPGVKYVLYGFKFLVVSTLNVFVIFTLEVLIFCS